MNHIDRDKAIELALAAMKDNGASDTCLVIGAQDLADAMNAAIQHYVEHCVTELTGLPYAVPVAAPKHEYVIDLPDGDTRETKVWWSEQKATGEGLSHRLSITVSETPSTVVVNADYREMWAEQVRMNQQLTAALAQPESEELTDADIEALCARIKAADDAAADRDYMLDSDDCIAVIRGTWKAPMMNDKPDKSLAAAKGGAV